MKKRYPVTIYIRDCKLEQILRWVALALGGLDPVAWQTHYTCCQGRDGRNKVWVLAKPELREIAEPSLKGSTYMFLWIRPQSHLQKITNTVSYKYCNHDCPTSEFASGEAR